MYKDIFTDIGLSSNESIVYEILLKNGQMTAGEIIKKSPLKRGVVYNALADLEQKELITQKQKNKIASFIPNHPEKLREYVEDKESKVLKAKNTLEANLSNIVSSFNLVSGKPGVRYFEGIEGVKKVIDDTLINNTSKEILAFSDVAGYVKHLKQWNKNYYAPKRRELQIHEKVIIPNNPTAMEYMKEYVKNPTSDALTDILFIDHQLFPFATEVNIYENKVSFVTFSEKTHIGVIIENKEIFASLSSIFNFAWALGQKQK